MHVSEILKEKGRAVETVTATVNLAEVVKALAVKRIGAAVVVDKDGRLQGIISERDIIRAISQSGPDALAFRVSEVMTRDVVTCFEADTIDELMAVMTNGRFRHLPVVEDGTLVGIVSIGDVVKYRVAEVELEASAMREYIAT